MIGKGPEKEPQSNNQPAALSDLLCAGCGQIYPASLVALLPERSIVDCPTYGCFGGFVGYISGGIIGDVLSRVFDGSPSAMVLNLIETADLDSDELTDLRKLISRKAKEQKK